MTVINNEGESRVTIQELAKAIKTMEDTEDSQSEALADLEMVVERLIRKLKFKTGEQVFDETEDED